MSTLFRISKKVGVVSAKAFAKKKKHLSLMQYDLELRKGVMFAIMSLLVITASDNT
jgi:hypothetical protein